MGVIDAAELRAMQSLQAELRAAHGARMSEILRQRFRLGRLLVDSGVIDEATLQAALASSRRSGRKLGEALVEAGAISAEVLQRFLDRQRRLTTVALAGAALSTIAPLPAAAGDRATVQVAATVLARASIDSQRLPREVAVSAADIERGYVDLQEPVEIGVQSNHPGGVVVSFVANSARLAQVQVQGAGPSVFVGQRDRGLQRRTLSVKLRLKLAPDAVPGNIAFPVSVFIAPA
jgi:hypothetical protein